MSNSKIIVTIPNITLTLDQLLDAMRQLDKSTRIKVAQVLLESETEMDAKMTALLRHLVEQRPVDSVSDDVVTAEIRAVRESRKKTQ